MKSAVLATMAMASANSREFSGSHAPSASGLKVTPSPAPAGSQLLLSMYPEESSFLMKPLRALYCNASPSTKKVGSAIIGAIQRARSTGLSAFMMVHRMNAKVR